MNKVILLIFPVLFFYNSYSQFMYKKQSAVGVSFFTIDFKTASNIREKGIGEIFKTRYKFMKPGLSLSYLKTINNNIDFVISSSGSFVDYPIPERVVSGRSSLLLQLTTMANVKLKTNKNWFTPFITAGAGFSKFKNYYGITFPAGVGLQFNFKEEVFVLLQSHYSFALTNNVTNYLFHSIGVAGNIKNKNQSANKIRPVIQTLNENNQDRDGDGIIDVADMCPDIPGLTSLNGCPKTDSDKDGINDDEDKCPNIAGIERYQGCPVPDTDNDGVNDEQDKCIADSGSINNYGCPVVDSIIIEKISTAAQNIFFSTGSAILLLKSYSALDEIYKILDKNPSYIISVEGHTDNIGNRNLNQILSDKRAVSVMSYLVTQGIAHNRITVRGYGQDKAIGDNSTLEGRSNNRRVEIRVYLK